MKLSNRNGWKLIPALLLLFTAQGVTAQQYELNSKDEQTRIRIQVNDRITWSVSKYGQVVLPEVVIGMTVNGTVLDEDPEVTSRRESETAESFEAVLPVKSRIIENDYRELQLKFANDFELHFRAYDHGVAYRFTTSRSGNIEVDSETLEISFPAGTTSYFPQEESMYSHYERSYLFKGIDTIRTGEFASLPILFNTKDDLRILFSEADVFDYPHLFLAGSGSKTLHAQFPKGVAATKPDPSSADRNVIITEEEPFIAATEGTRTFPWRFFVITNDDADLIRQNMVMQLSRPQILEETDWIQPGKIAWDWWNANNVFGVDFKSGLDTRTYKYYIDFASEYGLEYLILDEGWTKSTTEILECNPDLDVKELIRYGREKGVSLILWCLWKPLDDNMEEILDTYAGWGAKGVKVDFMQRADQYMVNSYTEIAKACADRKMLVDFHGAFKPAGLRSAYPNVISYEGVRGNEHNKWADYITPEHNVTLPFTRMAVGPMDYTPGAMHNAQEINFSVSFGRPMSLGTRAHQVAMYVVYESPLQMLCDTPSAYMQDEKTARFISGIPTVWDETKVLHAKVAEYVAVARRQGDDWYIGGMNNWDERSLEIDLSFLPAGTYEMTIFQDGINANTYAEDYRIESRTVNRSDQLSMDLAKGGGWTAVLRRK
ncbi:glycoside hydrolase family 97 protein [Flavilitoribacter nigricans]|uniref:Alpha-glucosidase n=1 Tax=Flavilitoribacter nigricans (strain ATCC 23147 / DSM 23189 / NBRC 102662 / NCIMB 1420 / SS-2) TaxID=1122177 RepID=A0A2D0NIF9_FLAN2|nr:glycoside hydrolase family 97 protein [Flavilitoribacter nigricans]PHN08237.1 alpha-glucosidase [Flavilitoribacter nigricans DSM 23189 = NBRC 102662]